MDISELKSVKDGLDRTFLEISGGIVSTIDELSRFISFNTSSVEYFFTGSGSPETFISDIIMSSESDLSRAINNAVEVMSSDTRVHSDVKSALGEIHNLKQSVDEITGMLEKIEIYSVNMIINSSKAGTGGNALAAISGEMADMSQLGGQLSNIVTAKMGELLASIPRFDELRFSIEDLHENKLTMIHLLSKNLFRGVYDEYAGLSGHVAAQFGILGAICIKLKDVTSGFQYEDIVRQNVEKIIFAAEELAGAQSVEGLQDAVLHPHVMQLLVGMKLNEVGGSIDTLTGSLSESIKQVISAGDVFSRELSDDGGGNSRRTTEVMSDINSKFGDLTGRFNEYSSVLTKKKSEMSEFLSLLQGEIRNFMIFLNQISDIVDDFKTIILLTTIELSRQDGLMKLLGGTLSDVRHIPSTIAAVIVEGKARQKSLSESFSGSVQKYNDYSNLQKQVVEESTDLLNIITVKLNESKYKYNAFLAKVAEGVESVGRLSADSLIKINHLSSFGKTLKGMIGQQAIPSKDAFAAEYKTELLEIVEHYRNASGVDSYRSMMLASLASEYTVKRSDVEQVSFF